MRRRKTPSIRLGRNLERVYSKRDPHSRTISWWVSRVGRWLVYVPEPSAETHSCKIKVLGVPVIILFLESPGWGSSSVTWWQTFICLHHQHHWSRSCQGCCIQTLLSLFSVLFFLIFTVLSGPPVRSSRQGVLLHMLGDVHIILSSWGSLDGHVL